LLRILGLWGYLFGVEVEAWKRFCAELHLDPEVLIRELPGFPTVRRAEEIARAYAFTEKEAAEAMRHKSAGDETIQTVESVLANFRAALASRESCWT